MSLYPFVQAKWYTKGGLKEARAVVIHMAEGGGTVSWLTHPTNDNSSHFVVEYSGRVVQMVAWADADHSLHWANPIASPPPFNPAVAKALLGTAGTADPNAYLIAIEVEGFAKDGPNPAQVKALTQLIAVLRSHYPTLRGLLGHRDFQSEKACPGIHMFEHFHHGAWPVPAPAPKPVPAPAPTPVPVPAPPAYPDVRPALAASQAEVVALKAKIDAATKALA